MKKIFLNYCKDKFMRNFSIIIICLLVLSILGIVFPAPANAANVSISGFAFQSSSITINVGDSVTWTNQDQAPHTVTGDAGGWGSSTLNNGGTFTRTFNTAGTFTYHCAIHLSMTGTVIVQAAYQTPYGTPYGYQTPYATPYSYQYEYQYQTPYATPVNPPPPSPAPTPTPIPPPPANSPTTLPDGALVKSNSTIYIIENGKKRGFTSLKIFKQMGYKLSNVSAVDASNIPQGEAIAVLSRHPRGTVVSNKSTIYFLGQDLRYPFPSAEVFFSWGHQFKEVVPANKYDLTLPLGPVSQKK
jgi:hypothetical protein